MNKLGKEITKRFFEEPTGYDKLEMEWRNQWRLDKSFDNPEGKAGWSSKLRPVHFFLYLAIRGKDWRKGFEPITNAVKLVNGMDPVRKSRACIEEIINASRNNQTDELLAPFNGRITDDGLRNLVMTLPHALQMNIFTEAYRDEARAQAAA